MNKICTKCKINKSLEDYHNDNRKKDNRKSECKKCHNIRIIEYRKTVVGKLVQVKSQAKYNKSDKGKLTQAKYYKSSKCKLTQANYNKSDKGKLIRTEYWKSAKGKSAIARGNNKRRTNIENTVNNLKDKEFSCILFLQQYKCACCGQYFDKVSPQRDHIKPVIMGGDFTKENIQVLCKSCNSKKNTQCFDYRTTIHKEKIISL